VKDLKTMARLKVIVSLCLIVSLGFMLIQGVQADNVISIQTAFATDSSTGSSYLSNTSVSEDVYKLTSPYIVGLKKGIDIDKFIDKKGFKNKKHTKSKKFKSTNALAIHLDQNELDSLQGDTEVSFIEVDAMVEIASAGKFQDDHPSYHFRNKDDQTTPWGIHAIGADIAQVHNYKGQSINIAVLDTGVADHPDLKVFGGISFVEGNSSYLDDHGHGTHVAGTIAASDNKFGVVGGAPKSKVFAVKVLDGSGQGSYSQVIQGIEWAIDQKVDVISISFGGIEYSQALHEAIRLANDNGILVIAAAGNRGPGEGTELYPALFPEVVSVGAVTQSHQIASYSSRGSKVDLVAPGTGVLSTTNNQGYGVLSGTSMAAPHVTSAAALLWAKNKNLTHLEVKNLLFSTATPLGDPTEYGHGLVNVAKGLELIEGPITPVLIEGMEDHQIPTNEEGEGEVSITGYGYVGDNQTITAGQSATVSVKLYEPKWKVYIGVFSPAGDKVAGTERDNVSAHVPISYTWYTSSSTPAGTYTIKYAYSGTSEAYNDYFTIKVNAPDQPQPPSAPSGLSTSSVTSYSITLNWSSVGGATYYQLQKDGHAVGVTQTNSYTFKDLSPGKSYLLGVAASNSNGTSPYNEITQQTLAAKPNLSMDIEYITKLTPEGNHYKELAGYQDRANVYSVKATISNSGNADANNVSLSFLQDSTTMKFIHGESSNKSVNIPKNGTRTVYWVSNLSTSEIRDRVEDFSVKLTHSASSTEIVKNGRIDVPGLVVVFIPGTMGSSLFHGSHNVWMIPPKPSFLDYTKYPNLITKEEHVIPLYYDEVKEELKSRGFNVYTYTYDWRKDINDNAERLNQRIASLGASKVDVVAHSQGGLIATVYAGNNPSKIRRIVNVGTPYYGSPETLNMFMTGDVSPFLNDRTLKEVIPTMPALYQMFPTHKYFDYDYYLQLTTTNRDEGRSSRYNYDDYNTMKGFLEYNYNSNLVSQADSFFKVFNENPSGVDMWNIVGDNIGTLGRISMDTVVRKINGKYYVNDSVSLYTVNGDGTVPLISANRGITNNSKTFYYSKIHSKQMGDSILIDKVGFILNGDPDRGSTLFKTQLSNNERLQLTINSPVDFHIYDKNGNHTGPNGTAIESNIPNSKYWMIDHHKIVSLDKGEYDIRLIGTDSGVFSYTIESIIDNEVLSKVRFIDVPIQKDSVVTTDINSNLNNTMLKIDQNNNGVVDTIVEPMFIAEGIDAKDTVPPILNLEIMGNKGKYSWYNSDVMIELVADDEGSGVHHTEYIENDLAIVEYKEPIVFDQEGSYVIQALAVDNVGNNSDLTILEIGIDKSKPESTINIEGSFGQNNWYTGTVIATITSEDILSGVALTQYSLDNGITWTEYNNPINLDEEGIYTLQFRSVDNAGNIEEVKESIINIDKSSSSTSYDIEGQQGTNNWYTSIVTVLFTATDSLSGVYEIQYSINNSSWEKYSTQLELVEDNIYDIKYRSTDLAGNIESENEIRIEVDKNSPKTEAIIEGNHGENGWFVEDVTVELRVEDNLSGVLLTEYSLNEGELWEQYSQPIHITEENIHKLLYRSIDNAGNKEEAQEIIIKLDKSSAETSYQLEGQQDTSNWYISNVNILLSATDSLSGVDRIQYSISNSNSWETYSTYLELIEDNIYDIRYRSIDLAGNIESENEFRIQVDKTSPETEVTIEGNHGENGWFVGDVTVKLTGEDNLSGVLLTEYSFDDGQTWKVFGAPIELTDDKVYTIQYRSIDIAGNVEKSNIVTVKLDQTEPEVSYTSLEREYYWDETLMIDFSGTDNLSGVQLIEGKLNGELIESGQPLVLQEPGLNTLFLRVKDKAGNEINEIQTFDVLIPASIDINPNVLSVPKGNANGRSNSNDKSVVTVFIELPNEFDVSLISPESITLNKDIRALDNSIKINKARNRIQVKFDRTEVEELFDQRGEVQIQIDGNYKFSDIHFRGFDFINVR
jgi:subtilisin family serine protease/pimeloyl-ACP methyl ester carboxylesterase